MKKTARKSRRGRPRSPSRSALTAAQIERADALARRTARAIEATLAGYLPAALVDVERQASERIIHARLLRVAHDLAPAIAATTGEREVFRLLDSGLQRGLSAAADALEATSLEPPPLDDPLLRPPGRLMPSRDLASARARAARLHAQLLDLRGRVVRHKK